MISYSSANTGVDYGCFGERPRPANSSGKGRLRFLGPRPRGLSGMLQSDILTPSSLDSSECSDFASPIQAIFDEIVDTS